MTKKKFKLLEEILKKEKTTFSNYQEIPKFIINNLTNDINFSKYKLNQIRLDSPRYKFLRKNLKIKPNKIIEIGSNIGFFILNLANDYNCIAVGYEPIKNYSKLTNLFASENNLEKFVKSYSQPVPLSKIEKLPKSDLIIELNVLHHAGNYFDKVMLNKLGGWRNYAKKRLKLLKSKTKRLFFQTGNSGKDTLFASKYSVEFISKLLIESGWKIEAFGTIRNLNKLTYDNGELSDSNSYTNYECKRNKKFVEYRKNNKFIKSMLTGMASRPIWICK